LQNCSLAIGNHQARLFVQLHGPCSAAFRYHFTALALLLVPPCHLRTAAQDYTVLRNVPARLLYGTAPPQGNSMAFLRGDASIRDYIVLQEATDSLPCGTTQPPEDSLLVFLCRWHALVKFVLCFGMSRLCQFKKFLISCFS
jgi:hypothetical protein